MRFGISEISWMLPKILRMRRAATLVRPPFLAGALIALVAMVFPALCGAHAVARPTNCAPADRRSAVLERYPGCPSPMRSVRAPTRTLSRRGREKLRAHVTVRRSRLFVGFGRYNLFAG